MGDNLEIQWLAGKPYLVVCNADNKWQPQAKELIPERYRKIEELESKHYTEMQKLLSTFNK